MNFRYAMTAIRRFGFKGIVEYLFRRPREYAFKRFLKSTLKNEAPSRGITLITCFDYPCSLSKAMRDFAILLNKTGIPYQTLNIPCDRPIPKSETQTFLTPEESFCANKFSHVITMRQPLQPFDKRCRFFSIEFWEFEDGYIESSPSVLNANEVVAFSDFNQDVFRKLLPSSIGVNKILYPFQFFHQELGSVEGTRQKYGIGTNDFVVFFNFDYESSYYRKNPEGILLAFAKAFNDKNDAKIVFKTMRAKKCKPMSDKLHSMANKLGLGERLITIDDFIPQDDLVNLTNACNVYMSLHRGEGFGLGIAEAMSLGKPVIVTDYSSTKEFCNSENAITIPYKMVKVRADQVDNETYRNVTMWADADYDAAADALLQLYNDPSLCSKLGNAGKKFIDTYFSIENFKRSVDAFLDAKN